MSTIHGSLLAGFIGLMATSVLAAPVEQTTREERMAAALRNYETQSKPPEEAQKMAPHRSDMRHPHVAHHQQMRHHPHAMKKHKAAKAS
jgi:hypothetical protein